MRKLKNTSGTGEQNLPRLKIVDDSANQSSLELEIDRHVRSIRALIRKLKPTERQRYYEGLLAHILTQPIDYPPARNKEAPAYDYTNLSYNELALIKELSMKINELYWLSECENSE